MSSYGGGLIAYIQDCISGKQFLAPLYIGHHNTRGYGMRADGDDDLTVGFVGFGLRLPILVLQRVLAAINESTEIPREVIFSANSLRFVTNWTVSTGFPGR